MGYSDSTANHLMMYKAGLTSFYGPSVMAEFGEYVKMFDYTKQAVFDILFNDSNGYEYLPSPEWSSDFIEWDEQNIHIQKKLRKEEHDYELLQGTGIVQGHLLGGCLDALHMYIGTEIWPTIDQWSNAILFLETSEDKPSPTFVTRTLRNLAAQGILHAVNGVIIGKPQDEVYYEEYKEAILQVIAREEKLTNLPVLYNLNFGHAAPIGILPYGIMVEINCSARSLTFKEPATM